MTSRRMLGRRAENQSPVPEPPKPEVPVIKYNNNIKEIRSLKQLDRVNLDFDSPRMKKAMVDLGVSSDECEKK